MEKYEKNKKNKSKELFLFYNKLEFKKNIIYVRKQLIDVSIEKIKKSCISLYIVYII